MFKVTIQNLQNSDLMWKNLECSTEQEANEWLQRQIGKPNRSLEEISYQITDITEEIIQKNINQENRAFLNSTDWKVLRHRDQLDAGSQTSLSDEEYQQLLADRQAARNAIQE